MASSGGKNACNLPRPTTHARAPFAFVETCGPSSANMMPRGEILMIDELIVMKRGLRLNGRQMGAVKFLMLAVTCSSFPRAPPEPVAPEGNHSSAGSGRRAEKNRTVVIVSKVPKTPRMIARRVRRDALGDGDWESALTFSAYA